jgi:hypothetical protein
MTAPSFCESCEGQTESRGAFSTRGRSKRAWLSGLTRPTLPDTLTLDFLDTEAQPTLSRQR